MIQRMKKGIMEGCWSDSIGFIGSIVNCMLFLGDSKDEKRAFGGRLFYRDVLDL